MNNDDRRIAAERRDWSTRFRHIHSILNHIESVGRNNIDLESLAESLGLPITVINRIFGELKNDYAHRFPWLKESFDITSEEM